VIEINAFRVGAIIRWPFVVCPWVDWVPDAFTLGHVIFYWTPPTDAIRRHERMHVEQARRLGTLRFFAAYLAEHFRRGYRFNKFELEAKAAEKEGDK
jgi:hypothetical protein